MAAKISWNENADADLLYIYTFVPMCVYNNIMTSWCFWCTIYAQNSNACMQIIWSKNVYTTVSVSSKTSLLLKFVSQSLTFNLGSLVKKKSKPHATVKGFDL